MQLTWSSIGLIVALLLMCGTASPVPAQEAPPPDKTREIDPLSDLVEQSLGLPAEFRADLLLRVLESGKSPKRWKLDRLTEEALGAADAVGESFRYSYSGKDGEARAVRQAAAYDLRLDRLSIRLRVINVLAGSRAAVARSLLEQTTPTGLRPAQCGQLLEPVLDDYYLTCARLANQALASARLKEREAAYPLIARCLQAPVATALAPAIQMTRAIRVVPERRAEVAAQLAAAMDQMPLSGADRGLILKDGVLSEAIDSLEQAMPAAGLSAAFQRLRVRVAAREACTPTTTYERLPSTERFSGLLVRLMARRSKGPPAGEGWEEDVHALLNRLSDFGIDPGECPVCTFHQRALMYFVVADFTPPGPMQRKAFTEWLAFLQRDPAQQAAPAEWLFQFELMLRLLRVPEQETANKIAELKVRGLALNMLPSAAAEYAQQLVRQSRDPVVAAYGRAEQLLPVPYTLPPDVAAK